MNEVIFLAHTSRLSKIALTFILVNTRQYNWGEQEEQPTYDAR